MDCGKGLLELNNFRPRLFHIENEEQLREYFNENAGYNFEMQIYQCAGVVSDDTAILWEKLFLEWRKDIAYEAKRQLLI